MSTVVVERGAKSYACWNYLKDNGVEYRSYRYYPVTDNDSSNGLLAFDIGDESIASYCALKFS